MGANEFGVVIGNEGLHARIAAHEDPALTGMDLVRLGLERAENAAEALSVVTQLLEAHGQGGDCGHLIPNYYHNGFLIADRREAFALETVGREWVAERIESATALSNCYSIAKPFRTSAGLKRFVDRVDTPSQEVPNCAAELGDPDREHIGWAQARRTRSTGLLNSLRSRLKAQDAMAILRDHGADPSKPWDPVLARERGGICVHAGTDEQPAQTTAAMISEIHAQGSEHWVTATAAPCISIFKPLLIDVSVPNHGPRPSDRFDGKALWWRHELLHRAVLQEDILEFIAAIEDERIVLEAEFVAAMGRARESGDPVERKRLIHQCWSDAGATEDRWRQQWLRIGAARRARNAAWERMNQVAEIDSI